jgi:hypothetical protein
MSIYATWLSLSADDHEDGCAVYVEDPPGSHCFEFSGKPCDCGTPRAPLVYEGSHVLPSNADRRGGCIDVAGIPDFIERDGRDDAKGSGLKDWLRLSVMNEESTLQYEGKSYVRGGDAAVVLDRRGVEELRDTLTAWLDRESIPDERECPECVEARQ